MPSCSAESAAPNLGKETEVKPTEVLIAEHKAVLVALNILEKVEDGIAAGVADAPEHLNQLIDFFGGFVDRCHHAKEEDALLHSYTALKAAIRAS